MYNINNYVLSADSNVCTFSDTIIVRVEGAVVGILE